MCKLHAVVVFWGFPKGFSCHVVNIHFRCENVVKLCYIFEDILEES